MRQLQTNRLKSSRNESEAENRSQPPRGLSLTAQPTYDREYNSLLTLEEATRP